LIYRSIVCGRRRSKFYKKHGIPLSICLLLDNPADRRGFPGYINLWFTAYVKPGRFAARLESKPAPLWGFLASLQRALMDSLLLYLPAALLGPVPPEPSYLSFIADEHYYFALVGLAPPVLIAEWLLGGAVIYMILRACRFKSGFDQILNITGFITLMIGTVLLAWDWIWIAVVSIGGGTAGSGINQYWLGISHLVIDLWGVALAAVNEEFGLVEKLRAVK
jgi:hypothetical protein